MAALSGLCLVGAAFLLVSLHDGRQVPPSASSSLHVPTLPLFAGAPFVGATETTIAGAESVLGFTIPRPSDSLASDSNVSQVWVDSKTGNVAIYYATGIRVFDDPRPQTPDALLAQAQGLIQGIGFGQVETVDGLPAAVIDQNFIGSCIGVPANGCPPAQNNPGSVGLFETGIKIDV